MTKLTSKISASIMLFSVLFVLLSSVVLKVFAGGGRVSITQLSQAEAGHSIQYVVQVYRKDNPTQVSVGERVQVRVKNGITGQVCDSPQVVTDGNGQVFGNCWSPINGAMLVYPYFPGDSPEESHIDSPTSIDFGSPISGPVVSSSPIPVSPPFVPSPSPSPMPVTPPVLPSPSPSPSPTPSSSPSPIPSPSPTPSPSPSPTPTTTSYILQPTQSFITLRRPFPFIGGFIGVLLRDANTGRIVTDQRGITYQWFTSDRGVVSIAEERICIPGFIGPCQNLLAGLRGVRNGHALLTIRAIKQGQVLATTFVLVRVQHD